MSGQDFFARLLLYAVREISEEIRRPQNERREEFAAAARNREEERRRRTEERVKSPEYKRQQEHDAKRREKERAWRAEAEERKNRRRMGDEVLREALVDGSYSFDRLKEHYLVPAIALVRPYPPHREPGGRSHVGGCPDLPPGTSWPRNDKGLPLHFLGQVDLAEAPTGHVGDLLPESGTLMFFHRFEGEMLTADADDARVLFDANSTGKLTPPPDDLPPVDSPWQRHFATTGDIAPSTWPQWPWRPVPIRSMPDAEAYQTNGRSDPSFADYRERRFEFQAEEIRRATGSSPSHRDPSPDLGIFQARDRREPFVLLPFAQSGFPWTACGMEFVIRSVLQFCARPDFAPFESKLRQWWARVDSRAPSERVTAEEAGAFIEMLNEILQSDAKSITSQKGNELLISGDRINLAIETAVYRLITETGGDPALAAAVPDALYAKAGHRHGTVQPAQMLGYMSSSQTPLAVDASTLTLLQLPSDYGIDLIIGDAGEFDFQIEPDALVRRDWESASVSYAGG